jgi:hypothetical protein
VFKGGHVDRSAILLLRKVAANQMFQANKYRLQPFKSISGDPLNLLKEQCKGHSTGKGHRSKLLPAAFAYAACGRAISFHICTPSVSVRDDGLIRSRGVEYEKGWRHGRELKRSAEVVGLT